MEQVVAVHKSAEHLFSKQTVNQIQLIANEGVEGDAHRGVKVQHRSRVRQDPNQPNLRQVHLIHAELIEELQGKGFNVEAGSMGENITTAGIDLLGLPQGTELIFPSGATIVVTGLRNPCAQLNQYQKGLTAAVLDKDEQGNIIRKAGIMGIVKSGGRVIAGDAIDVVLPERPWQALERV